MVITGVAEREAARLRSIVFLDAFLPQNGQSVADLGGSSPSATRGPVPAVPASVMVNPQDAPWVQSKLTPQPGGTFLDPVANTGAIMGLNRRTYIQATVGASPISIATYNACRADPRWDTHQLACRHDAMLDLPDELTALLLAQAIK